MSRKSDNDNHSNQLNPNHPEYVNCRNHRPSSGDGDDEDVDGFSAVATPSRPPEMLAQPHLRPNTSIDVIEFPVEGRNEIPVHFVILAAAVADFKV